MLSTKTCIAVLLALAAVMGYAQVPPKQMYERSEAEQRAFVREFLDAGLPLGPSPHGAEYVDPVDDLDSLVRLKSWVLPLLAHKIEELRALPAPPQELIRRLGYYISRAGTVEALQTIQRLFTSNPHYEYLVRSVIYSARGSTRKNVAVVWYAALESPDPVIRHEAEGIVSGVLQYPSDRDLRESAEAALDRYQHVPNEQEIVYDPLFRMISQQNDPGKAAELRQRLLTEANKIVQQRQKGGAPSQ